MPGFIGVRYGELVPVVPDSQSPDVYIWDAGVFAIITFEEEVVLRESPGADIIAVWSHGAVNDVRAAIGLDEAVVIYTSHDGGKTWAETIDEQPQIEFAMLFDEIYALSADHLRIRFSRTAGTTWFDGGAAPSGGRIDSGILASTNFIYGFVSPTE